VLLRLILYARFAPGFFFWPNYKSMIVAGWNSKVIPEASA
jgi:hypothetical protein